MAASYANTSPRVQCFEEKAISEHMHLLWSLSLWSLCPFLSMHAPPVSSNLMNTTSLPRQASAYWLAVKTYIGQGTACCGIKAACGKRRCDTHTCRVGKREPAPSSPFLPFHCCTLHLLSLPLGPTWAPWAPPGPCLFLCPAVPSSSAFRFFPRHVWQAYT